MCAALVQSPVLVSPQTPKSYHSQLYSNTSLPHSVLFIRFRLSVKERGGGSDSYLWEIKSSISNTSYTKSESKVLSIFKGSEGLIHVPT